MKVSDIKFKVPEQFTGMTNVNINDLIGKTFRITMLHRYETRVYDEDKKEYVKNDDGTDAMRAGFYIGINVPNEAGEAVPMYFVTKAKNIVKLCDTIIASGCDLSELDPVTVDFRTFNGKKVFELNDADV